MFKQVLLREAKYSVLDNTVSILRLLIIEVKERKKYLNRKIQRSTYIQITMR